MWVCVCALWRVCVRACVRMYSCVCAVYVLAYAYVCVCAYSINTVDVSTLWIRVPMRVPLFMRGCVYVRALGVMRTCACVCACIKRVFA